MPKTSQVETQVVKQEAVGSLAEIPEYLKGLVGKTDGAEGIKPEDARVPRLKVAQGMSPQMQRGTESYLPDLRLGDMFNDLSGEIYGEGPLEVAFIRVDPPRHVLFDKEDRKKVLERDLKPSDARTQFRDGADGKRLKPEASKFYDYVLVRLDTMEPLAMSFSSTGINMAMKLNGMLKIKPVPIYVQKFSLSVAQQHNDQGTWYGVTVRPSQFVPADMVERLQSLFESFKAKKVEFDESHPETSPGTGESPDVPF